LSGWLCVNTLIHTFMKGTFVLNNVKVGTKLIAGFLLVAAIAAFIGLMGINSAKKLDDLNDEMYTVRVAPLKAVDLINLDLAKMRVAIRTMAMAGSDEAWKAEAASFEESKKSVDDGIETLDRLKGKKLLSDIKKNYAEFLRASKGVMDATAKKRVVPDTSISAALAHAREPSLNVARDADELQGLISDFAKAGWENSNETHKSVSTLLITMLIIGVVISVLLGFFLSRDINMPLLKTVKMLDELKRGHLSTRLKMERGDEIGQMAKSMDAFADDLQNVVIDTLKKISEGDLSGEIEPNGIKDEVSHALKTTMESLRGVVSVMKHISEGNLSDAIESKGDKDMISAALTQVAEAAAQVESASSEISDGAQSLAEGSNEQASSLEEVSSSLEEMSSMTKQNAENSGQAQILASEASAAEELSSQAAELAKMVREFTLSAGTAIGKNETRHQIGTTYGQNDRRGNNLRSQRHKHATRPPLVDKTEKRKTYGQGITKTSMKAVKAEVIIPLDEDDLNEF